MELRELLRWQLGLSWSLAELRLAGLTDDACRWEPAPELDRPVGFPWPEPRPLAVAAAWANQELMKNVPRSASSATCTAHSGPLPGGEPDERRAAGTDRVDAVTEGATVRPSGSACVPGSGPRRSGRRASGRGVDD